MGTGLQANIYSGIREEGWFDYRGKCMNFCMWPSILLMVSFPNDFFIVHNHTANQWIGAYLSFSSFGDVQGIIEEQRSLQIWKPRVSSKR